MSVVFTLLLFQLINKVQFTSANRKMGLLRDWENFTLLMDLILLELLVEEYQMVKEGL